MVKHIVVLEIVTDPQQSFPPTEWNWNDLLDVGENEYANAVYVAEVSCEQKSED